MKEVVEFTRIAQPVNHDDDELQTMFSPDRMRAFIVTRRSDVATDTNTFEILLLDVDPAHLAAGRPAAPVSLLKVVARKDSYDLDPSLRDVRWHDNRTLVFRARIQDEAFQAYRFDVPTRKLARLTNAPDGVLAYDVSSDLKRVVYVSPESNPAIPPGARSAVVGTNSFWNVHNGQLGPRFQQRRYQGFVTDARPGAVPRPLGSSFAESNMSYPRPSISPDGRWAALPRYVSGREQAWAKEYPLVAQAVATYTSAQTQDPLSYFSRRTHYVPRLTIFYRLADGHEQPVVDAPDDSIQLGQQRSDRLWQDGGRSVVIGGIFLPKRPGDRESPSTSTSASNSDTASDTASGTAVDSASASHIIEYWPDTGRWKDIAPLANRLEALYPIAGRPGTFVAIDGVAHRRFERDSQGAWRELAAGGSTTLGPSGEGSANAVHDRSAAGQPEGQSAGQSAGPSSGQFAGQFAGQWRLHVQEALNQPPDVVALGPAGQTVRLTELNPTYSVAQWGSMGVYDWTDARGRPWNGGLMVPSDFNPATRYPLVIQTYAFSPTRFYRDGPNTYDGATSGFAGRAFLREGFLVLVVPYSPTTGRAPLDDYHSRALQLTDGVRGAVDKLVAAGWVDRERVGILGWSATGEQVLNLVTFSDLPIRAASIMDPDSNTLFSMTITYGFAEGVQARKDVVNEGLPYGESLQRWVRNDPSLHTDCIHTALRIESYGPEVRNDWDIYALMRRQYKPVEMVVIPQGAHSLARPSERMISLQGNVDWYRFWLKDERRSEVLIPGETAASLEQQYGRWDEMKALKLADDARPRCAVAVEGHSP